MKFVRICALFFLTILYSTSFAQNATVEYLGKEKVKFYRVNELLVQEIVMFDTSNNRFITNIDAPVIYESMGFHEPLILFPHDSLSLNTTSGKNTFYSYKNPKRNREIECAKKIFDTYGSFVYEDYNAQDRIPLVPNKNKGDKPFEFYKTKFPKTQSNDADRDSVIYAVYKKRIDILDEYKNNISSEFYSLISNWLFYRYLYLSIKGYEYSMNSSLSPRLNSFLSTKTIYTESLIQNINTYCAFLFFYNSYLTAIQLKRNPTAIEKLKHADTAFAGNNRDRVMLSIIYEHLQAKKFDSILVSFFYAKCNNEVYKNRIKDYFKAYQIMSTDSATEFLNLQKEKISFKDILANNKGRLIYIDFWASWCSPCLAEMDHLKKLQERYKGRNISFLSVSMDGDIGNWEEMLQRNIFSNSMERNKHFLLINNFQSEIAKNFSIVSIPKFCLLDQNGNIITLKAPKPSDSDIYEFIDKLL